MDHDDRGVMSLPKLVGGPRYSRPPVAGVAQTPRPPDPDELPLVSERTPEDHALALELGIESPPLGILGASPVRATPARHDAPAKAGDGTSSWTAGDGAGGQARSLHRGFGLFRRRSGRSGIG